MTHKKCKKDKTDSTRSRHWKFDIIGDRCLFEDLTGITCICKKWQYMCFNIYTDDNILSQRVTGYIYFTNAVRIKTLKKYIMYGSINKCDSVEDIEEILIIDGEFYEYGIKPTQGKSKIINEFEYPKRAIKERLRMKFCKLMNYPINLSKIEDIDEVHAWQLFRSQFVEMIKKNLQKLNIDNILPGVNDLNNFYNYIENSHQGICIKISSDINEKYIEETGKSFDCLTLDRIKNADYCISKKTKTITINHFDIFNDNYEYSKEKDLIKLKMYFLKNFIPVLLKWNQYDISKNRKAHKKMTQFNDIIKLTKIQYIHKTKYYDFSYLFLMDECIDKYIVTQLIEFIV